MGLSMGRFGDFGKRAKPAASEKLLNRVLKLKQEGYSRSEIAKVVNRSPAMVTNYTKQLVKLGKLNVTESGRIENTQAQNQKIDQMLKSDWISGKNPEVKKWIEEMQVAGKGGKPLTHLSNYVSSLYNVCRTLEISPTAFLISTDETKRLLTEFKKIYDTGESYKSYKGHDNSPYQKSIIGYVKAVASFCEKNNKPFPPNQSGILSRKKENYGAYSTVHFSDLEFNKILDFLHDHSTPSQNWEALAAIGHETLPRPYTLMTMQNTFEVKEDVINDHICTWAEASIYEKKTHKSFDKLIFYRRCLELVKSLQKHKTIIEYSSLKDTQSKWNDLLRQAYAYVGKIAPEAVKDRYFYKKVIDGDRYYLAWEPGHSLRHSGCHLWLRRCDYNITYVMSLGWEDSNMITDVYGSMPSSQRLKAGRCDFCRPGKTLIETADKQFCSWSHAVTYFSGGKFNAN